jgi:hypothetical protein
MAIIAIGGMVAIMTEGRGNQYIGIIAFVIISMVEFLMLIIGNFLGFIGLGVTFSVVILASAVVVLVARKVLMGSG